MAAPIPSTEDARRFEAHLAPLLPSAYRVALHLSRDPDDAADLVQEAAFLAFRAFHQYAEGTRFKAWFFRILTNAYFQRYRKKKREPDPVEFEDVPALYLYDQCERTGISGREPDPADFVLSKLSTEHVMQAIAALPEEFRVVAALHLVEDFGYQEVADMLGIPIGTVRSRLHRGRRLLQKALWTLAEELGVAGPRPAEPAKEPG
jgi:RNA polymerase sigma-70 factor (ECF subfamily)